MHSIFTFTAIMAAIATSIAQPTPEAHFKRAISGQGELHALVNGEEAGCVAARGLLTVNEDYCGTFTARQTGSGSKFELIVKDVHNLRCAARSNNAFHSFACTDTATATKFSADGNFLVNPATGDTAWLVESFPTQADSAHFYSKLDGSSKSIELQWKST